MAKTPATQPNQFEQLQQQNQIARSLIMRSGVEMIQQIFSTTLQGAAAGQVVNIPVRPVGLIKRFIVKVEATLAQAAAETLNRTAHGAANILSNITLTDFSNYQRINTAGWHLAMLATARRGNAFGAAFTNDSTSGVGSNMPVFNAPAAISVAQNLCHFYEVPLAYSDADFRGAMWGNVTNANANLQLTVNPNLVVGSGGSGTLAAYKSTTANDKGNLTNFKITVYQVYIDQIPYNGSQPILPALDLSNIYELKNTVFTGFAVGQDNPIPYASFRQFLSTSAIVDQNGTLNNGSDVTRWKLSSANMLNIMDVDPMTALLATRNEIGDDFPLGTYYFSHRKKPIDTQSYGNMQLILVPSSFVANAQVLVGFESLSMSSVVTQAPSLPAN